MVVGFNHNFRYKNTVYHVQTEDGGVKFPAIITHLFIGGTILKTKKTSYADIIKADHLEQVVEELMKDQHRDMMRRLRSGEFDEIIKKFGIAPDTEKTAVTTEANAVAAPPAATSEHPVNPASAAVLPLSRPSPPVAAPAAAASSEASLDDIILSYLLGENGQ